MPVPDGIGVRYPAHRRWVTPQGDGTDTHYLISPLKVGHHLCARVRDINNSRDEIPFLKTKNVGKPEMEITYPFSIVAGVLQNYSHSRIMEPKNYPGKGLSLPQLIFALNAELNSMSYSSS